MKSRTQKSHGTSRDRNPEDEPSPSASVANEPEEDATETDDLDDLDALHPEDQHWDAFLADDDERDPQPDPNDFWFET